MKPLLVGREEETSDLTGALTFVLWTLCLVVGGLGLAMPYAAPAPPKKTPVTRIDAVEARLERPHVAPVKTAATLRQPPSDEAPTIPQPTPVALPSPTIAFAVPVKGPVEIVPERHAAPAANPPAPMTRAAPAPAAQTLVFGQGEGDQPAPEYPDRARREGQEGTVIVRFTVGEDGRVMAAEARSPSPWNLLNEAAVKTVRERWRFRPGPVRLYEVAIRFELQ